MCYIILDDYQMNTAGELRHTGPLLATPRRVQMCPVCTGRGWMPAGFYTVTPGILHFASGTTAGELCQTCNGQGVI